MRLLYLFSLIIFLPTLLSAQVRISEFSGNTSNSENLNDAFIELYCPDNDGCNVGCHLISNGEWAVTLPSGTTIPEDGYLLIACSESTENATGSCGETITGSGISCDDCDFPGIDNSFVNFFDVCDPDNASYFDPAIGGFELDNESINNTDQIILFSPNGGIIEAYNYGYNNPDFDLTEDNNEIANGNSYTLGSNFIGIEYVVQIPDGFGDCDFSGISFTIPAFDSNEFTSLSSFQTYCNSSFVIDESGNVNETKHPTPGQTNDVAGDVIFPDTSINLCLADASSGGIAHTIEIQTLNFQHIQNSIQNADGDMGSLVIDPLDSSPFVFSDSGSAFNEWTSISDPDNNGISTLTYNIMWDDITDAANTGSLNPNGNIYQLVIADFANCRGTDFPDGTFGSDCFYNIFNFTLNIFEPISLTGAAEDLSINCGTETPPGIIDFSQFISGNGDLTFELYENGSGSPSETNTTGVFEITDDASVNEYELVIIDNSPCVPPATGSYTLQISENCEQAVQGCPTVSTTSFSNQTSFCANEPIQLELTLDDFPPGAGISIYLDTAGVIDPNDLTTLPDIALLDTIPETTFAGGIDTIFISEIYIDVLSTGNCGQGAGQISAEWLEIGGTPGLDISCYSLSDGENTLTFPPGTVMPPDGYLIIYNGNCTAFDPYVDSFDFDFSNCNCFYDYVAPDAGTLQTLSLEINNDDDSFVLFDASGNALSGLQFGTENTSNETYPLNNLYTGCTTPSAYNLSTISTANGLLVNILSNELEQGQTNGAPDWEATGSGDPFGNIGQSGGQPDMTGYAGDFVTAIDFNLPFSFDTFSLDESFCGETFTIYAVIDGCNSLVSQTISIDCPETTVGDIEFCSGETTPISFSGWLAENINLAGEFYSVDYTVDGVAQQPLAGNDFSQFSINQNGVIEITGVSLGFPVQEPVNFPSCHTFQSFQITILDTPQNQSATADNNCPKTVTFELADVDGVFTYTYTTPSGTEITDFSSSSTVTIPALEEGTYTLIEVVNSAGCTSGILSETANISPATPPDFGNLTFDACYSDDGVAENDSTYTFNEIISSFGNLNGNFAFYYLDPLIYDQSTLTEIDTIGISNQYPEDETIYFVFTDTDNCQYVGNIAVISGNAACGELTCENVLIEVLIDENTEQCIPLNGEFQVTFDTNDIQNNYTDGTVDTYWFYTPNDSSSIDLTNVIITPTPAIGGFNFLGINEIKTRCYGIISFDIDATDAANINLTDYNDFENLIDVLNADGICFGWDTQCIDFVETYIFENDEFLEEDLANTFNTNADTAFYCQAENQTLTLPATIGGIEGTWYLLPEIFEASNIITEIDLTTPFSNTYYFYADNPEDGNCERGSFNFEVVRSFTLQVSDESVCQSATECISFQSLISNDFFDPDPDQAESDYIFNNLTFTHDADPTENIFDTDNLVFCPRLEGTYTLTIDASNVEDFCVDIPTASFVINVGSSGSLETFQVESCGTLPFTFNLDNIEDTISVASGTSISWLELDKNTPVSGDYSITNSVDQIWIVTQLNTCSDTTEFFLNVNEVNPPDVSVYTLCEEIETPDQASFNLTNYADTLANLNLSYLGEWYLEANGNTVIPDSTEYTSGTSSVYAAVNDENGCSYNIEITLEVFPQTELSDHSDNFCLDESTIIDLNDYNAIIGAEFLDVTWFNTDEQADPVEDVSNFGLAITDTVYAIVFSDVNECPSSLAEVILNVGNISVTIAENEFAFCDNDTEFQTGTFTISVDNPNTDFEYNWFVGNSTTAENPSPVDNFSFSYPAQTQTYAVQAYDPIADCTSERVEYTVTVNEAPALELETENACAVNEGGGTFTFDIESINATTGTITSWYLLSGNDTIELSDLIVEPGNYLAANDDGSGCIGYDNFDVVNCTCFNISENPNEKVDITIGANSATFFDGYWGLCGNNSYSIDILTFDEAPDANITVNWYYPDGTNNLGAPINLQPTINPSTLITECPDSAFINVAIYCSTQPDTFVDSFTIDLLLFPEAISNAISLEPDADNCSFNLGGSGLCSENLYTYQWEDSDGNTGQGTEYTPDTPYPTSVTFTIINEFYDDYNLPCAASETVSLPAYNLNPPIISGLEDIEICGSDEITISFNDEPSNTYTWYSDMELTDEIGTGNSYTATFTETTTLYVEAVSNFYPSCTISDSVTITNGTPEEPTDLECYQTATLNEESCEWVVSGDQPEEPTDLACYESATFDNDACDWVITGDQPEEPTDLACYESATFDNGTCDWVITGDQPEEPTDLACYESATFDNDACDWVITGEQPEEPTDLACYESATFDNDACNWVISGDQPEEPTDLTCYESATFDNDACDWVISGDQPEEPTDLTCYESATFDNDACDWVVTGEQPEEPTTACYETATFNDESCGWDISGEQPAQPTDIACYETVGAFNETDCSWIINGEQPEINDGCDITDDSFDDENCIVVNTPNCPEGTSFNSIDCACDTDVIVGCTDPCATNYDPTANSDDGSCNFPEEPTDLACYQTATFNDDPAVCAWEVTGEQPEEPTGLACFETATFNGDPTVCAWEITGEQPEAPADLECYQTTTFNGDPAVCAWEVSGEQPEEPTDLACYQTATFNGDPAVCAWEVSGEQPEEPTDLACYQTASFNDDSAVCSWEITGEAPDVNDNCDITTDSYDEVTCEIINTPDCPEGTSFNSVDCTCDTDVIEGCTDPCATNYNPDANSENGSCTYPEAPETACYQTATFNDDPAVCAWEVSGEQSEEPTDLACYQTATFNGDPAVCAWEVSGEQPEEPTDLACYQTASFNDDSAVCSWEITGEAPDVNDNCDITTDSYDEVTCEIINTPDCPEGTSFNSVDCTCDTNVIEGCTDPCATNYNPDANSENGSCNYPEEPETACYETANFNDDPAVCAWEVSGEQPEEPTDLACYQTTTFNEDPAVCAWEVIGEQPEINDDCDITIDSFDEENCIVVNTPDCPADTTFDAENCTCVSDPCDAISDQTEEPVICPGTIYTSPISGNDYTASGSEIIGPDENGCSFTLTVNLSFSEPQNTSENGTICDDGSNSFFSNAGTEYTTDGTFEEEFEDANGCTAINTVNVTAITCSDACPIFENLIVTPAGNYSDTICFGNSITLDLFVTAGSDTSTTTWHYPTGITEQRGISAGDEVVPVQVFNSNDPFYQSACPEEYEVFVTIDCSTDTIRKDLLVYPPLEQLAIDFDTLAGCGVSLNNPCPDFYRVYLLDAQGNWLTTNTAPVEPVGNIATFIIANQDTLSNCAFVEGSQFIEVEYIFPECDCPEPSGLQLGDSGFLNETMDTVFACSGALIELSLTDLSDSLRIDWYFGNDLNNAIAEDQDTLQLNQTVPACASLPFEIVYEVSCPNDPANPETGSFILFIYSDVEESISYSAPTCTVSAISDCNEYEVYYDVLSDNTVNWILGNTSPDNINGTDSIQFMIINPAINVDLACDTTFSEVFIVSCNPNCTDPDFASTLHIDGFVSPSCSGDQIFMNIPNYDPDSYNYRWSSSLGSGLAMLDTSDYANPVISPTGNGNLDFYFIVDNGALCIDTTTLELEILQNPSLENAITQSTSSIACGDSVLFIIDSYLNATSYAWYDTIPSSPNANLIYETTDTFYYYQGSEEGSSIFYLVASNQNTCYDTIPGGLTVNVAACENCEVPDIELSIFADTLLTCSVFSESQGIYTPPIVALSDNVQLTGEAVSFNWTISPNVSGSGCTNGLDTFDASLDITNCLFDFYDISLIATDANGCTDTIEFVLEYFSVAPGLEINENSLISICPPDFGPVLVDVIQTDVQFGIPESFIDYIVIQNSNFQSDVDTVYFGNGEFSTSIPIDSTGVYDIIYAQNIKGCGTTFENLNFEITEGYSPNYQLLDMDGNILTETDTLTCNAQGDSLLFQIQVFDGNDAVSDELSLQGNLVQAAFGITDTLLTDEFILPIQISTNDYSTSFNLGNATNGCQFEYEIVPPVIPINNPTNCIDCFADAGAQMLYDITDENVDGSTVCSGSGIIVYSDYVTSPDYGYTYILTDINGDVINIQFPGVFELNDPFNPSQGLSFGEYQIIGVSFYLGNEDELDPENTSITLNGNNISGLTVINQEAGVLGTLADNDYCLDTFAVQINVVEEPNAGAVIPGTANPIQLCTNQDTIDLFDYINFYDTNGTWFANSNAGSVPAGALIDSLLLPPVLDSGNTYEASNYSFQYIVENGICADTTELFFEVWDSLSAELSLQDLTLCNDSTLGIGFIFLDSLLQIDTDTSGSWIFAPNEFTVSNDTLYAEGANPSTNYVMNYSVPTPEGSVCPEISDQIQLTVSPCEGCPNIVDLDFDDFICTNGNTTFDLSLQSDSLIDGLEFEIVYAEEALADVFIYSPVSISLGLSVAEDSTATFTDLVVPPITGAIDTFYLYGIYPNADIDCRPYFMDTLFVSAGGVEVQFTPDTLYYCEQGDLVNIQLSGANNFEWADSSLIVPISDTEANLIAGTPSTSYVVTALADNEACNVTDTIMLNRYTLQLSFSEVFDFELDTLVHCLGDLPTALDTVYVPHDTLINPVISYVWSPPSGVSDINDPMPDFNPDQSTLYTLTVETQEGCSISEELFVYVPNDAGFTINGESRDSIDVCIGDTIAFTIPEMEAGFVWESGGALIANEISPNTYSTTEINADETIIYSGTIGGCTVSDTLTIIAVPELNVDIQVVNDEVCVGSVAELSAIGNAANYYWINLNNDTLSNSIQFAYNLVQENDTIILSGVTGTCFDTDTLALTQVIGPQSANLTLLCPDDTLMIMGNGYTILDATPSLGIIENGNYIINNEGQVTEDSSLTITWSDTDPCPSETNYNIVLDNANQAEWTMDSILVGCVGDPVLLAPQLPEGVTLTWEGGLGTFDNPLVFPTNYNPDLSESTVTLTAAVDDACTNLQYYDVIIDFIEYDTLTAQAESTLISTGQSVLLNVSGGSGNYLWTPDFPLNIDTGSTVIATPFESTTFIVSDTSQCVTVDSLLIEVVQAKLIIPTAFSPNGDGVNDFYQIQGNNLEEFNFKVYNRWGVKLVELTEVNEIWDGRHKGELQDLGVYMYVIEYKFEGLSKRIESGNITIVR